MELVKKINDNPIETYPYYTDAVADLILIGDEVIPHVLPLLVDDDLFTRKRAERVLQGVTARHYGYLETLGWQVEGGQERWEAFWKQLGDLDAEASPEERKKAIELWKKCYATRLNKAAGSTSTHK